ncbi:MAG: septal ring lytic transglycosylase RlpA family protein [Candidatus Daviesbacteria bacterium]|nr:septal ring lytic transglycosylase RlpA family protein [Candidatus Daviesbacteria bacterium]
MNIESALDKITHSPTVIRWTKHAAFPLGAFLALTLSQSYHQQITLDQGKPPVPIIGPLSPDFYRPVSTSTPEPTHTPNPTPESTPISGISRLASIGIQPKETVASYPIIGTSWEGKGSTYSRTGCVGCREDLKMANGEDLDDDALAIAFNRAPLGSKLRLENLDNGNIVIVEVKDTGGFESPTYNNRLFDATIAVSNQLGGVITDHTQVKITLLELPNYYSR